MSGRKESNRTSNSLHQTVAELLGSRWSLFVEPSSRVLDLNHVVKPGMPKLILLGWLSWNWNIASYTFIYIISIPLIMGFYPIKSPANSTSNSITNCFFQSCQLLMHPLNHILRYCIPWHSQHYPNTISVKDPRKFTDWLWHNPRFQMDFSIRWWIFFKPMSPFLISDDFSVGLPVSWCQFWHLSGN